MTKFISYLVSAMMMLSALFGMPVFAEESDGTGYLDSSDCSTWTLENGKSYYIDPKYSDGDGYIDYYLIWKSVHGENASIYRSIVMEDSVTGNLISTLAVNTNFADSASEASIVYGTQSYIFTVSGDDVEMGIFDHTSERVFDDEGNFLEVIDVIGDPHDIDDLLSIEADGTHSPREITIKAGQSIKIEKNTTVNMDSGKERATGGSELTISPLTIGSHGNAVFRSGDSEPSEKEITDTTYEPFYQMVAQLGTIPNKGDIVEINCDAGSILVSLPDMNLPYYDLSGLFEDIPETMWYHDVVYETFKYGLMTGTDASHFEPNSQMTRAMVATVLYRMAGSPEVTGNSGFSDVPDGMYYSDPVTWAVQAGVVTGYTTGDKAGTFGPNDNVTREQLCTMAYRYLDKVAGKDTSAQADLDGFNDKDQVSGYAVDAVKYCVAKGIISGAENGTMLYPLNNATRAECAKILLNTSKVE